MTGKGITGGIYHSFYRYAKVDNKYTKDYEKNQKKAMSSVLGCK